MSLVLYRLGRWVFDHRRLVVAAWLALLVLVGASAALAGGKTDDAFTIPGSQSQEALDQLRRTFPASAGVSAELLVTVPPGHDVRDQAVRDVVAEAITRLEGIDQVATVTSPYNAMISGQIADSGRALIVNVPLDVDAMQVTDVTRHEIQEVANVAVSALPPGSSVDVGGGSFTDDIPTLSLLEAVGLVIALFTLLALFRSLLASMLPLLTALTGIGVALSLIMVSAAITTVSSTAPMLALMLGVAVGIDYALLILSRHRDQLATGMPVAESVARATATAGSAVVFAGMTVIIAVLGLSVVGIPFLTVMGIGAAVAVAIALAVALTLLPATMALAGERLRPRPRRRRADGAEPERHHAFNDIAHGWVRRVTRHPWAAMLGVLAVVVLLALPAPSLRLALPDNGAQPQGNPARITHDKIAAEFGPGYNGPLIVTADIVASRDPLGVMNGLRTDIEALEGVKLVALATPNQTADTGIVQVIPESSPQSPETADLVERIRGHADIWQERYGVATAVTGFTAVGIDVSNRLAGSLVPFGIVVVGLSLVLLTIVFRSIAIPISATLGYLLSISAAFGLTALVFTHGWFADLFRVQQVGSVISFLPILLMGLLFGLAMDYQVFIVSRIAEEYARTRDPQRAIIDGFTASAPVVTAAAIIMLSVFAAFIPANNANLKPIAFALTVGVAVDAFLVRMTLVPAVMQLLGNRGWWLPAWLERRLPHLDIEGEGVLRELRLANWPEPDSDLLVAARDVNVLDAYGTPLLQLPDLRMRAGDAVMLRCPAPRWGGASGGEASGGAASGEVADATAYAIAGRLTSLSGDLKVCGLVLPERARSVRRRVALVECRTMDDQLIGEVSAADASQVPLLVLTGGDTPLAARPTDTLRELLTSYRADGGAVIIIGHDAALATDILGVDVPVHDLVVPGQPGLATVATPQEMSS